jgi:transcriptional regulator with XRE-family HTH domain
MNLEIDYTKLLGERLETALVLRKKSKSELSEATKITAQTLTNIAAAKGDTSFARVARIAKVLGLSLDYFASPTDHERDVYAKSEVNLVSKIRPLINEIRMLNAEDKQLLFEFVLPKIILELENELKSRFKMIDWR